jgi:hypothetical protein
MLIILISHFPFTEEQQEQTIAIHLVCINGQVTGSSMVIPLINMKLFIKLATEEL